MPGNRLYDTMIAVIRNEAGSGTLPGRLRNVTLTPQTRLGELGLDSLAKVTLLAALMDATDGYLPDELFDDGHTLAEIAFRAVAA